MSSPRALLREALKAQGLTNATLRKRCGLDCTPSSISRKLNGLQSLTADEAIRMGRVLGVKVPSAAACRSLEARLGVTILWAPERKRGAA